MIKHSSYLECIFNPNRHNKIIDKVVEAINKNMKKDKIEAIAFRGNSGAGIAYPVSYLTGLPLICVRKTSSKSHGQSVEMGSGEYKNYIIIDDFSSTGNTIKEIWAAISDCDIKLNCTAIYLYHSDFIPSRIKNYHVKVRQI